MLNINIIVQKLTHKKYILFFSFWLIVIALYSPAYKAGFYEDFLEFAEKYQKLPFFDFLNLTPSSLYQGVNLFHYVFLQLFALSPIPWFLLFTSLHALNGVLIFNFFRKFFAALNCMQSEIIALAGAFIWLISPVVCEAVTWKATSHYLTSTGLILLILNLLLTWLHHAKTKYQVTILLLYALSTTMLEFFYLTPLFVLTITIVLYAADRIDKSIAGKAIKRILIPLIAIWCLYYLVLNQLTHKATARADFDINLLLSPSYILSKLIKYLFYIVGLEFFLPQSLRSTLHRFTEHTATHIVAGGFLLFYTIWGFIRFRSLQVGPRTIFVLFILTGISCIIILPMWFYDTFAYQGSRYYYLPGIFFYMLFTFILLQRNSYRPLRYFILLLYIAVCVIGTLALIIRVKNATHVFYGIMKNFRWQNENKVFLLNLPTLQNGVGIIGAGEPSNFAYHLRIFRSDSIKSRIYDVSSYNMTGRWDGAHVSVIDSMTLKVTPNQYGSWWWYAGFGASDYENEEYKVNFTDGGFSYIVQFKRKPEAGTVILFQVGEDWKEVDMNRLHEEQW